MLARQLQAPIPTPILRTRARISSLFAGKTVSCLSCWDSCGTGYRRKPWAQRNQCQGIVDNTRYRLQVNMGEEAVNMGEEA